MFAKTLDWFFKYYPEVILSLVIVYITWKVAGLYFKRFCPLEKKVDSIDTNLEIIQKDINGMKENHFPKIERVLDKLSCFLLMKYPKDKDLILTQSPIELTDLAKEILNVSGAIKFIDNSLDGLIVKITECNPKSDLDIQQFAVSILFNLVDTDAFTEIKDFIYNNPKYKGQYDIDIQIMINLSALYLRDKYLAKSGDVRPN